MAKPKKERQVLYPPTVVFFKPQGIPLLQLQQVVLTVDEYEAIRLVDYEGLDQEKAAKKLRISRATCARIVGDAHKKIAEAITQGKAIRIEGGSFALLKNLIRCRACGRLWETAANSEVGSQEKGSEESVSCPRCSSPRTIDLGKVAKGGSRGRGRGLKSKRRGARQGRAR